MATPVLRTDFSASERWEAVRTAIDSPSMDAYGFVPDVEFVDDPDYRDLSTEQILALVPGSWAHPILVVFDRIAVASAEFPLLVIDLMAERGREMRVIAAELWSIEANLSISNMDFHEFADGADEDGVFRGFPEE
ncbi:DUF6924 domain-containing protein [Embleya sp. NBC_00896]|uniref:DUF6924 domain-containing protein n=1 Tax=Embleya sp. NBC_00896 TaxID=2975961 RepID=UPI00386D72BA|nr:hypothetical protein OG928_38790 [Embleya sp. NBC_00896]